MVKGNRWVGLLSTIIAAPVVLGLEIAALVSGTLKVAGNLSVAGTQSKPKSMIRSECWLRAN